jgi:hypothetical protein
MDRALSTRIDRMLRRDRLFAVVILAAMWLAVIFCFVMLLPLVGDARIVAALAVGAGLLLFLNTASIVAMLRHYADDRAVIYGLDVRHLDEMRAARRRPATAAVRTAGARP